MWKRRGRLDTIIIPETIIQINLRTVVGAIWFLAEAVKEVVLFQGDIFGGGLEGSHFSRVWAG